MRRRAAALIALAVALTGPVLAGGSPAVATPVVPPSQQAYVLYYTVAASYQGKPETLWEIAGRLLGDSGRAGEILSLNSGHAQPDGARLDNAGDLHAGWHLVLPWDAVGPGVQYGLLPSAAATPTPSPAAVPQRTPAARPTATGTAGTPRPSRGCRPVTAVPSSAYWGQTLLDPGRAWTVADGAGVRVAVIDSGVDSDAPELADRVTAGADIIAGTGHGDTDCLGSGTALAGIVAGADGASGGHFGLAPQATIVPVRVATKATLVPAKAAATAIAVAVSTGAQIITVGGHIDATDPAVRAAIGNALAHDVVVVVPATTAARGSLPAADGLLRAAAVGDDHALAAAYPAGSFDLVAPGVQVATIGGRGTGAEYAGAFVAGAVALVRSAHPTLSATEAGRLVLRTATPWTPASAYAAGLVNPYGAVTAPLPAGLVSGTARPVERGDVLRSVLVWTAFAVLLLMILWWWLRHVRVRRAARAERDRLLDDDDDPFRPAGDRLVGSGRGGAASTSE